MNAYRLPNHDACLLDGSTDEDSPLRDVLIERIQADPEEMKLAREWACDNAPDSTHLNEVVMNAYPMLLQLFMEDVTVSQAFENASTDQIIAFRTLLREAQQLDRLVDDAIAVRAQEMIDTGEA